MYATLDYRICAVAADLLVASLAAPAEGNQNHAPNCRYLPEDSHWPTEEDWSQLNKTIEGRLIRGVPLAQSCHPPGLDKAACAKIQNEWVLTQT